MQSTSPELFNSTKSAPTPGLPDVMRRRASAYSPAAGERRRDEGIARVMDANAEWRDRALEIVEEIARTHTELTADEVRRAVRLLPSHSNCWGGLMTTAARRGWIIATDRTRQSIRTAAHRHRNPIWQSLIYGQPKAEVNG